MDEHGDEDKPGDADERPEGRGLDHRLNRLIRCRQTQLVRPTARKVMIRLSIIASLTVASVLSLLAG